MEAGVTPHETTLRDVRTRSVKIAPFYKQRRISQSFQKTIFRILMLQLQQKSLKHFKLATIIVQLISHKGVFIKGIRKLRDK